MVRKLDFRSTSRLRFSPGKLKTCRLINSAVCSLLIGLTRDFFDNYDKLVATFSEISSPQQLEQLQPTYELADNVIVDLLDWQRTLLQHFMLLTKQSLPSQRSSNFLRETPEYLSFIISLLYALEQGLGGVVLKTEDVEAVLELKEYFDKINKQGSQLGLTKATITRVEMTGMGDRVCFDLCSLMRPGEGLLMRSLLAQLTNEKNAALEQSKRIRQEMHPPKKSNCAANDDEKEKTSRNLELFDVQDEFRSKKSHINPF
ncbi:hypothetical protein L2E82_18997 [Cichorium intybus]|uniref:Uncharacterized protein n=1 Tax=Cichorium intybus TaxID=13427 RepID=A0ACB9FC12_CICIN|nr:hypothetical protein L2E82_18997 [Cichorium intybus]